MTLWDIAILVAVGWGAGCIGGLIGIGGSIIMIPVLTELFGPDQHLYQSAAMIVNFFVAAPAVIQHQRAGAIQWPLVRWSASVAFFCVVLGVACSELPYFVGTGQRYLIGLFGAFLIYVAGFQIYTMALARKKHVEPDGRRTRVRRVGTLLGIPTGFIGGLLGVGGGIIAVPIQVRLFRIPIRNAVANSAVTIIGVSAVGAVVKNYGLVKIQDRELTESLVLAGLLAPTAIIGSLMGSRWTHRVPIKAVSLVFAGLLLIAGIRMAMQMWTLD